MCHSDGAWRRRGRCLTLDGGLVLAAILVHCCYLRHGGGGEGTGRQLEDDRQIDDIIVSVKDECTFLRCFLKSLGCWRKKEININTPEVQLGSRKYYKASEGHMLWWGRWVKGHSTVLCLVISSHEISLHLK